MRKWNKPISLYLSSGLILLIVLAALLHPWLLPHGLDADDRINVRQRLVDGRIVMSAPPLPPDGTYWLGTDHRGYDMVSLLLNGLPYTLGIAALLTLLRFALALPWGMWTGTTGRGAGFLRTMQWVVSAVPAFLFLYPPLAGMYFGLGLNHGGMAVAYPGAMTGFTAMFAALLTFHGVFPLAYQLADRARHYDGKMYVDVSRLMGGKRRHRIFRHILPNMRLEMLFTALGSSSRCCSSWDSSRCSRS